MAQAMESSGTTTMCSGQSSDIKCRKNLFHPLQLSSIWSLWKKTTFVTLNA